MRPLPAEPLIYEINTWIWLAELEARYSRRVTLSNVPAAEWDGIAALGFDAVWLMGVWERSPAGVAIALEDEGLMRSFREAVPDITDEHVAGSPYCIRGYRTDRRLGGRRGLAAARKALSDRGLSLILDFVPNHVAPDHPWVLEHPQYFIRGDEGDRVRDPESFLNAGGETIARGRDPYFPAWPDVLQLNAFDAGMREATVETLREMAAQCDGVRCDMAMLMMNEIFRRTWGERAGEVPEIDYWPLVIPRVREVYPRFTFIAEAYWDLEGELLAQGFDYCYDKRLYDRVERDFVEDLRAHLRAESWYQRRMVRFVENHDEPRASAVFHRDKLRAALVVILTLPGARLLHEGQLEGRRIRVPVFLGRRSEEDPDHDLAAFHRRLLSALPRSRTTSEWRLLEPSGWPDNDSHRNLLAWSWNGDEGNLVVVVNFSSAPAQARVPFPFEGIEEQQWRLEDALSGNVYERDGHELRDPGLFVDLAPWGCHLLRF